jgi:hypothetical protein
MGTGGSSSRAGPVPLSALLDEAAKRIPSTASGPLPSDGFLFSGNRHDSVPRRLLLDTRLTPLERNAWQVFRLLLNDDGITAFPTYEALRPYLASMPCTPKASHETVARALTLLRLTRWLSLVRRRRDPRTGRIQGNLYVLHDEPLTPFEAMQLDPDYLGLVSQALTHASKAVQRVGLHTLREIADDPLLSGRSLPTRLQVLAQRLADEHIGKTPGYPQESNATKSEEGEYALLRNDAPPASESEVGRKPAPDGSLRNPKQDRTVRRDRMYEVRTVPRARDTEDAQAPSLPRRFQALKAEQQAGALVALQQVEPASLRQAVLDEWDARCRTSTVRNPAGYLFGIIQKAIRGEFKAWVGQHPPVHGQARFAATPGRPFSDAPYPPIPRWPGSISSTCDRCCA